MIIDWDAIDTVLLDMDGTLLDLNFDNFFWQRYLPDRYAQIKGIKPELACQQINLQTKAIEGSLDWYSTDYWSEVLELDVVGLKHEIRHQVSMRPFCEDFLNALRAAGKDVVMVTNAHQDSLNLKMNVTRLADKFDRLITVHEFAVPKEDPDCWIEVNKRHPFERAKTLLIDDNQRALRSARVYGIAHLLAIYRPDSKAPVIELEDFDAISHFDEIMPN